MINAFLKKHIKDKFTPNSSTITKSIKFHFCSKRMTGDLVFKQQMPSSSENEPVFNSNSLTKLPHLAHAVSSKIYYDLLDEHDKMQIPFSDDEFYKKLFDLSTQIMNNGNLESWYIIGRYAIFNMDSLEINFLTAIIEQLALVKWYDFNFWYYAEKRVIKDIKLFSCRDLSTVVFAFGSNDKGSNYLFSVFAEEVLDRKMKSFNKDEFYAIYEGFKMNKIRNKLLWAILNKAKEELFSQENQ